jgi:hypothetical protein
LLAVPINRVVDELHDHGRRTGPRGLALKDTG